MKLYKVFLTIAMVIFTGFSVFAQSADYDALLKTVDKLVTFEETDLSAEYTIIEKAPDGSSSTTVAAMFRRDKTEEFLILIFEPIVDKGKGYLKTGKNMWLYDPIGKSFTFTSAKERFQNSSFRLSDFTGSSYSKEYEVISGEKQKLGKFNCTVLELNALTNSVSFPKKKIWISDDNLVRKIEDYSLSGQIMRTSAIPNYQKTGNRWVPASIVIQDHLVFRKVEGKTVYERTLVSIKKPSLAKQPDSIYTKEYLERVNR